MSSGPSADSARGFPTFRGGWGWLFAGQVARESAHSLLLGNQLTPGAWPSGSQSQGLVISGFVNPHTWTQG